SGPAGRTKPGPIPTSRSMRGAPSGAPRLFRLRLALLLLERVDALREVVDGRLLVVSGGLRLVARVLRVGHVLAQGLEPGVELHDVIGLGRLRDGGLKRLDSPRQRLLELAEAA